MSKSDDYYKDILSAEKLKRCYEIAPQRVKQYLEAETNYVIQKLLPNDLLLELGCGYGRVLSLFSKKVKKVIGIDNSQSSILLGEKIYSDLLNCTFLEMDAIKLNFPDNSFDKVICIQNGISAFHVNKKELISEAIRVTKPGGTALFSSYSEKFWNQRLQWFILQSEAGLLGEIDFEKTKNGNIICKDGFSASTVNEEEFRKLVTGFENIDFSIIEIDNSSLFCEIILFK